MGLTKCLKYGTFYKEGANMKKSIFQKELENAKFKAIYEENAMKLSLGERIAELRHKRKMTQSELAKKVHTSRTAIARYENGEYAHYNLFTLLRIAKAFKKELEVKFI